MTPATIVLVQQFIALAIQYGPELAEQGAALLGLIESNQDPTDEQKAAFDAALEKANRDLAAAIEARNTPA